jgi:hypothetical protein
MHKCPKEPINMLLKYQIYFHLILSFYLKQKILNYFKNKLNEYILFYFNIVLITLSFRYIGL